MRIKNAWWGSPPPDLEHEDEGFDIHVLANGVPSRGLLQVLRIEYEVPDPADPHGPPILQETNASVASNHNITIRFIPQFNFQPAGGNDPKVVKHTTPMAPNPADQTPAVPVTVHMGNGQVRLTAPLPSGAGVLRNFIIRVTITDEKDTSSNKDFSGHPAIRIHLHDNIRSAWLTPSTFLLHRDSSTDQFRRPRLRVLAEFTDDTVGDVSYDPNQTTWSGSNAAVEVNNRGGLRAKADTGSATITATLPPALSQQAVTACVVNAAPPLSTPTAAHLVGHTKGQHLIPGHLNFLFLSEGFVSDDGTFTTLVTALEKFMGKSPRTWPFKLFRKQINFWRAFVPSPAEGTSVLSELFPVVRDGMDHWRPVPLPDFTAIGQGNARLAQVVALAGLPTKADRAITAIAGSSGMMAKWTANYGTFANPLSGHVSQALYDRWLALADRALLDEIDSAFSIRFGERPKVDTGTAHDFALMSDLRMRRPHLDDFLRGLTDGTDTLGDPDTSRPIGATWAGSNQQDVPDPPDAAFVCFLCAGALTGGVRDPYTNTLSVGLTDETELLTGQIAPPALARTLFPWGTGPDPSLNIETTVAHEFAHAIGPIGLSGGPIFSGLGDEYGINNELRIPVPEEEDVANHANLQTERSVKVGTQINGDLIRWASWHRIKKAAQIKTITQLPGKFRLELVKGPPERFKEGETIRLRKRPLATTVLATALLTSPELKIEDRESATKIVVVPDSMTLFSAWSVLAGPGAGDIVFVSETAGGQELMLVSKVIRDHITATGRPLNALPPTGPNPPGHVCVRTGGGTQRALNRPTSGLRADRHPPWSAFLVGLYDGGLRYNCGVFHPTGACLMRRTLVIPDPPLPLPPDASPIHAFCDVCRYILVDNVDPTKHGENDRDYRDRRWPEPKPP